MFDGLSVVLHFAHQGVQPGQAQADHPLTLFYGATGIAAGLCGLAGVPGHLLNGGFQFAQRVANQRGITGLAFCAAMQAGAEFGQGMAAALNLLGVQADSADQVHEVGPQAIQRFFDVAQFAVGRAQLDVLGEIPVGPGRQRGRKIGQNAGQAALQGVDQQRDQEDQADHQALHHPHIALDKCVLSADFRFQASDCFLQRVDFELSAGAEFCAALNLIPGPVQLGGVTVKQAAQFTFVAHAAVFGDGFLAIAQAHHGGEVFSARLGTGCDAEQWQGIQRLRLGAYGRDFAFDIGGQLTAAAADQFVPGQAQACQVL